MSDPLRHALVAAARRSPREAPVWRRYHDPHTGFSLEAPFDLVPEDEATPFETLVSGRTKFPYVLDVTYMAAPNTVSDAPEAMAREIATQWMVDYPLVSGPQVRRVERDGVEESWSVSAEIQNEAGTIGYVWHVLRRDGRIGCVGLSCWSVEPLGREALQRVSHSISGG